MIKIAEEQVDKDARRIANEVTFGDHQNALRLWQQSISELKTFEVIVLRDKIQKLVQELESAKNQLSQAKTNSLGG